MSSVRGVNVGGNLFGVTDSTNIAPIETTNFATRAYAKDRCFIMVDGLLYRATAEIESGDPIVINGNCKRTTLDEIISVIETDSDLIAPTEDGATSSANYAVGNEIVRSGILYKVISAITQGDAFAIGSNIDIAGSLTSQIQTLTNNDDAMLNVLGAKNLLPNNATSQTADGVTFTVNTDPSSEEYGAITASGTATKPSGVTTSGLSFYIVTSTNPHTLKKGTYKLTGWVDEVPDNVNLSIADRATYTNICTVSGDFPEQTFTLSGDTSVYAVLLMKWGTTINKTFYPMIRPASVADDTYVPYAMTNRELTEEALDYEVISSVTSGTVHYVVSFACGYRHGNHYHVEVIGEYDGQVSNATTVPFFKISGIPTISANRRVGTVIIHDDTIAPACATIHTDGYIYQTMKSSVSSGNVSFILDFYIK